MSKKQSITLVETWTQGEDSYYGTETKTGKTHKNLTLAQAQKIIRDNPRKKYDIYVDGQRVMLWSEAGRPFRVGPMYERAPKRAPAPKIATTPKPKPAPKARKPDIPPCLVMQAELDAPESGQTYFAGSGPKRKGKKAAKKTKKKEKKGSGSLAAFGVMPEGQTTLDEMAEELMK